MKKDLLPPNATSLEISLDKASNRIAELSTCHKDLWNPWKCPEVLLPWLAWAVSCDEWSSAWPEEIKRRVISESISVHKIKGTKGGMKRALKALDAGIEIHEFDGIEGPSHSGEIFIYAGNSLATNGDTLITPELQNQIMRVVSNTKPVRSNFSLSLGLKHSSSLGLACSATSLKRETLKMKLAPETDIEGGVSFAGSFSPNLTINRISLEVE